ncbi:S49 family peptidase [Hydrogenophaga sp.]|uniref:S49 family peptidase n=1 Tax=Hydrogenophaga sp. TaxID=1904254 RepID=UPI0019BF9158|nr:S49 family peptidase [Hydrogenophaga sp.]MBD3892508.1 S49 family peptidase [Hydrogenophaga sp.]
MNNDQVALPASPEPERNWERSTLEKILLATIKEQQTARRWKIFMRLLWLALVLTVLALLYSAGRVSPAIAAPHTALIEIRGEIVAGAEASAANVVASLHAAFEDEGAQAIVLLIDSPGGSPVQAGIINDEITRLKALHRKRVYAVVEETCASAAYYVAAAADKIFVDKASLIGSIGVMMGSFGFTGLMEKMGVERRLMLAGENKALLDPFSPQDEVQRAYIQALLSEIHQQFIEVVKAGRGDRLQVGPETFSGLVWSGQQAVELGLADGLGNLDYVAREVIKAEKIVDYTQRQNIGLRLVERLGVSLGEGLFLAARAAGAELK